MGWYPSSTSETGLVWVDEDLQTEENDRILTSPEYIQKVMNATDEEIYKDIDESED